MIVVTYTLEIYNTDVRVVALGFCNLFARFGGVVMPLAGLGLKAQFGKYCAYYMFMGLIVIDLILLPFLPYETLGRPLDDL